MAKILLFDFLDHCEYGCCTPWVLVDWHNLRTFYWGIQAFPQGPSQLVEISLVSLILIQAQRAHEVGAMRDRLKAPGVSQQHETEFWIPELRAVMEKLVKSISQLKDQYNVFDSNVRPRPDPSKDTLFGPPIGPDSSSFARNSQLNVQKQKEGAECCQSGRHGNSSSKTPALEHPWTTGWNNWRSVHSSWRKAVVSLCQLLKGLHCLVSYQDDQSGGSMEGLVHKSCYNVCSTKPLW